MAKTHDDGTLCLEGTLKVPRGFKSCCEAFDRRTRSCVYDIRYEWLSKKKQWGIAISESAGGGYIIMHYCPHCGARLNR